MKKWIIIPLYMLCILFTACGKKKATRAELEARIDSLQAALNVFTTDTSLTHANLNAADTSDYSLFNNKQWERFSITHDAGVRVYYPDGGLSVGLNPQHIDMLKPMFAFAPDTKIFKHRTSFGSNGWTAVIGEIKGTFTDTMFTPEGKKYPPTGKEFMFLTCTIAKWEKGKIIDEYLFWDNHAFLKQLGLIM